MLTQNSMANPLKQTELLYINSKNRFSGAPHDFTVSIPNNMFNIFDRQGRIRVTVLDAVMNRSWYTIQDNNNSFQVSNGTDAVTYDIPVGYYTVKSLQPVLSKLLPAWTIIYDKYTDKFTYRPPDDGLTYTFTFQDACCDLFGFHETSTPSGTHADPIVSLHPVKVNRESVVLIHTDIPKLENSVVDNVLNTEFVESNILIKIPVTVAPFDNLTYQSNGTDPFSFITTSTNLNSLRFWVTDEHGRDLLLPYDWTLTLQIEYIYANTDNQDLRGNVARIKDYLQYMTLSDQRFSSAQ